MVNAKALQAEMQKLNAKKMAEAHQQAEKLAALRAQRQQEEARLKHIQQEAEKKLAEAKEAQKQAEQKQAEQKQAELKKAELKKTQEKLQQKLLAQQLAEESKAIKAQAAREAKQRQAAQAAANRGLLDQYRAKIVRAIQMNWHPLQQDAQRSCQFLVYLAPGGKVTGVELVKTSGDTALDQSARLAIFKASPLPVPHEAAVFDEFRQFRIKMTPEDIQGMG
jgi:colicin import membrane protein